MGLHLAAPAPRVVLDAASGRIECVADGHVDVMVRRRLAVVPVHHQLSAGHRQIDADIVEPALVMVTVRRGHHHPATRDPVIEAVQLGGLVANGLLDTARGFHVAEGHLQFEFHRPLPS